MPDPIREALESVLETLRQAKDVDQLAGLPARSSLALKAHRQLTSAITLLDKLKPNYRVTEESPARILVSDLAVVGGFSPRLVANPRWFVFEVGTDGFNAYEQKPAGLECFAASSSASTFMKISEAMDAVMRSNGNTKKEGVS